MEKSLLPAADLIGKRVYFLYPNSVIQNEMVSQLIHDEYEIYLVKNHLKALALFRRHPNSVIFLNIDEGQEEPAWEEYVQTLQNDPDLETLQIGILTYNEDPVLAEKYLMQMMISGGFIKLGLGLKESTVLVRRVLEANEAKGRRKYLRVRCGSKNTSLNVRHEEKSLLGTVMDISSAGMACTFEPDPRLVHHVAVNSIQLKLKGILCLVSGIVMGSRQDGDLLVYVILFSNKTDPGVKEKIRSYMQWALQHQVEEELQAID